MSGFKSLPKIPRYPIAPPETPVVETAKDSHSTTEGTVPLDGTKPGPDKQRESRFDTEGIVRVEGTKSGLGGPERFRREKEHARRTKAFKREQYEVRFAKNQERIRKAEEEKRAEEKLLDDFKVEFQANLDAHAELEAAEYRAHPQHRQDLDKLKPRADTCWPPAGL